MNNKYYIIQHIAEHIRDNNITAARDIILNEYPFSPIYVEHRSYTIKQKMEQFVKDGFIDRYSGARLLNPGILKVISYHFPDEFPYHPHWKVSESHFAYWELVPTIDHINPIAKGGCDKPENWVTTSMMHNAVKSNWTLEQLQWRLYPAGDMKDWDGLTELFIDIVERDTGLLKDSYIKNWYNASMYI